MPKRSASRACDSTQSSTVTTGKSAPQGAPVRGSMLAGPVDPWHPPRLFTPITKNFSVSSGLPGPNRLSQQPKVIRQSAHDLSHSVLPHILLQQSLLVLFGQHRRIVISHIPVQDHFGRRDPFVVLTVAHTVCEPVAKLQLVYATGHRQRDNLRFVQLG